jgi:ring-1,2-phenylacetyl-CoA epoxidase subunit PaaB
MHWMHMPKSRKPSARWLDQEGQETGTVSDSIRFAASAWTARLHSKEFSVMSKNDWPLWEVFIRSQHGLAHKHVGSLHAPDAEMAINNARDVYTRRNEGVSIWVVRAADIAASSPGDKGPLFEPSNTKVYRHPTFFPMPDGINM